MKKFVLISVINREISTDFFETIEEARIKMKETYSEFVEDCEEDDSADFGTDETCQAWVTSCYDNVDLAIHEIL